MKTIIGVIPARMAASRLPGKPLRPLLGVAMLERVFRQAALCPQLRRVLVATEDDCIVQFCRDRGIPVEWTGPQPSGTDRVAALAERMDGDTFVNIQGDQPLFDPEQLVHLLDVFHRHPAAQVATLAAPLALGSPDSPHTVKVVMAADGRALYFSRAGLPYAVGPPATPRWQHIGLYAYTPGALASFRELGPSPLESLERLEQLRFLEGGVPIHVGRTDIVTPSVDTPADAEAVERTLREAQARVGPGAAGHV